MLTSLQNTTVKHLVRMRDNRARRKAGSVLVDGWRETRRALEAGLVPRGVYLTESSFAEASIRGDASEGDSLSEATDSVQDAKDREVVRSLSAGHTVLVGASVMQKISYGQSDRGIVAEFETPRHHLCDIVLPANPLLLVLDHLEKPGNIGAAFRCADAVGADAVLVTPSATDLFNPNTIRSSLGAVFSTPAVACDEPEARQWLAANEIAVVAARVQSSKPMWEIDLRDPVAVVIGSEADGLGDHWMPSQDVSVQSARIPMAGSVDSLNASVSAALILYEARRQRN